MKYKRGLKGRHVSLIALGGIIGSSYFLGTGYVVGQIGPSAFLAYALGGIITFLTMACLAELTISVPMSASFVGYASRYVSPAWACGVGWSYWISWVVYIPSECLAGGILMHNFVPSIPIYLWAILFGLLITLINLWHVKAFGEMEFWLAMIKIILLVGFSALAIAIFFGWVGPQTPPIGDRYLLQEGGLFPNGYLIFFINMVILLSNYQGSEIIGLSAAESQHPHTAIPRALKQISLRIIVLYLLPTFLLTLIFPWKSSNLKGSVFSVALEQYGLVKIGHVFSFLIIAAALSCANSGLYATVRSLRALCHRGMGPKALAELNGHGIPVKATLVTLLSVWLMLGISYFFSAHSLYANLLALSGFTGAVCWISICWAQLKFRNRLIIQEKLHLLRGYRIFGFPYVTHFAIWIQVLCLAVVVLSPQLRASFYFGVPSVILPILFYKHYHKMKRRKRRKELAKNS